MTRLAAIACCFVLAACFDFVRRSVDPSTTTTSGLQPLLSATTPAHDATSVILTTEIALLFSKEMRPDTVMVQSDPPIALALNEWNDELQAVSYIVTTPLQPATTYAVTVSGLDAEGLAMGNLRSFSFTTRAAPTNPTITASVPAAGAMGVATATQLSLTFSKPMTSVNVVATPARDLGEPTWNDAHTVATFDHPVAAWAQATLYEIEADGVDADGLGLSGTTRFSFHTVDPAATAAPQIAGSIPEQGATNVFRNSLITVQFTKAMNPATVVMSVSNGVSCAFGWDASGTLYTCQPSANLPATTPIIVTIASTAADTFGNLLAGPTQVSFQTSAVVDMTAPTVTATDPPLSDPPPVDVIDRVSPSTNIRLDFSKPMDAAATQAAFSINPPSINVAAVGTFAWSNGGTTMHFTPPASLGFGTTVTWRLSTAAKSNGVAMAAQVTGMFKTHQRLTTTPIYGEAALDGQVNDQGTISELGAEIRVGDYVFQASHRVLRGFLSFSLNSLPANLLTIQSATLSIYTAGPVGEPFEPGHSLGVVRARSILFGSPLTASAWDAPVHTYGACGGTGGVCALISCNIITNDDAGAKSCGITTKVKRDWEDAANTGKHCQFRLDRPVNTNDDAGSDDNRVYMTEVTTQSYRPNIVVTYDAPSPWP
ncbi:MAG: Ig-like domain-containing protein [Deltaproteobacteria bacterium]|nr:Ig-like domain-containing protein [Deltaproteobacteria bacterium]